MRSAPIAAALALALGPAPGPSAPQDLERYQGGVFALDVPAGWRELGPNEALRLGDRLPLDMRDVAPAQVLVLGDVDAWLEAGRFTGDALLVVARQFERPVDAAQLREIQAFWEGWEGPGGARREVLRSGVTALGPEAHPALELEMRLFPGSGGEPLRTLDDYASTMGQQLILSFRTWENRWQESEPMFRRMADSLTFARPPAEPAELGDKLFFWALLGALVGVGLLVARRLVKQRQALAGPHDPNPR